jgi:hypothetical protein
MSNVRDIRNHPKFRVREQNPESNPNQERDEYLRYLDSQEAPDPFDNLEPASEPPTRRPSEPVAMREPEFGGGSFWIGLSVCSHCEHRRDLRPWYRRLLSRPKIHQLFCEASPRKKTLEPITGTEGYLPHGTKIPANAQAEPFDQCVTINCLGTCPRFKPTITYR